jgi:hypothetical protein
MPRILAILVLALAVPAAAGAAPITYTAVLDGPSEFPPNASLGTGAATVTYDPVTHILGVLTSFSGLTGDTTAAHIHCCVSPSAATPLANVATTVPTFPDFPLGVKMGSYLMGFDLTDAGSWNPAFVTANGGTLTGAEAALAAGLDSGMAYFNIHTSTSQSGEIRGFLVPEPSTLLLVGAGVAGMAVSVRRRRRS